MTADDIFNKLFLAETEEEVDLILQDSFFKNVRWEPFDHDKSSFSTINNQQKEAVSALVEKLMNSIDHILIKECLLLGINPQSKDAPTNMKEAVQKLMGIKDADISKLKPDNRRKLAENVMLIAEGHKEFPTLTICDQGEGQSPEDLPETILSLHRGNKAKIRFVQGKFNMGGSGALKFCGTKRYQLVISKRHPDLVNQGHSTKWGFTLVRRFTDIDETDRHTWYEYFTNADNKIFTTNENVLGIEDKKISYGTIIKLFNYDLERWSYVTRDLWKDLNMKFFEPNLPVLIIESRKKHYKITKGKNDTKVLVGNRGRVNYEDHKWVKKNFSIISDLGPFGKKKIEITLFKDELDGSKFPKSEFVNQNDTIFLTVNGQTHHTEGKSFIKSRAKKEYLSDYIMVHIDCTDLPVEINEDIFAGSRDRVFEVKYFRDFKEKLATDLKENEILIELEEEYKQRELARFKKESKDFDKEIYRLLKDNPLLRNFFLPGMDIEIPSEKPGKEKIKFEPAYIPTYLKTKTENFVKEFPISSKHVWLVLETDASDDYLERKKDNGTLLFSPEISSSEYLFEGNLYIKINKPNDSKVGDKRSLKIGLTRPDRDNLECECDLLFVEPLIKKPGPIGHPEPRENNQKGFKLPQHREVRKAQWNGDWNENKISKIKGDVIFINMDANPIINFIQNFPKKIGLNEITRIETFYLIGVMLNSISLKKKMEDMKMEDPNDEFFDISMNATAQLFLPLTYNAEYISNLKI